METVTYLYFVNQRGYLVLTHHCEKMPMTMDGLWDKSISHLLNLFHTTSTYLTEVLIPTDRKHEYWEDR